MNAEEALNDIFEISEKAERDLIIEFSQRGRKPQSREEIKKQQAEKNTMVAKHTSICITHKNGNLNE